MMKKSWRDRGVGEFVSAPWLAFVFVAIFIIIGFLAIWFWTH